MNTNISFAVQTTLVLLLVVFVVGFLMMFLRDRVVWALAGQMVSLKALVGLVLLMSVFGKFGDRELSYFALALLGISPLILAMGFLTIHRAKASNGTNNWDQEQNLKG